MVTGFPSGVLGVVAAGDSSYKIAAESKSTKIFCYDSSNSQKGVYAVPAPVRPRSPAANTWPSDKAACGDYSPQAAFAFDRRCASSWAIWVTVL